MSYEKKKCDSWGCSRWQAVKEKRCGQKWYRRWCWFHHRCPEMRCVIEPIKHYKPIPITDLVIIEELAGK